MSMVSHAQSRSTRRDLSVCCQVGKMVGVGESDSKTTMNSNGKTRLKSNGISNGHSKKNGNSTVSVCVAVIYYILCWLIFILCQQPDVSGSPRARPAVSFTCSHIHSSESSWTCSCSTKNLRFFL